MMKPHLQISLTLLACCGAAWFYVDALSSFMLDRDYMESQIRATTRLQVGRAEPCITEVTLSTWEAMNELSIYRWVAMCEAEHGL